VSSGKTEDFLDLFFRLLHCESPSQDIMGVFSVHNLLPHFGKLFPSFLHGVLAQ
jgi:hypothetical protein